MRVYDSRIGKFLSVDPLSSKYPWYTPYQFSGNTPIQAVDIDGREDVHYIFIWVKTASGKEIVMKLGGELVGKELGGVDAKGRGIFDRPYKIHAHYPTNLYGRTVFSTATYDSEEAFSNAKASDFRMSAIGAASEVSAGIANELGGAMSASFLFAKAGQYLTAKTISMLADAKAAQFTASSVNRAAVDNLIKENVDNALQEALPELGRIQSRINVTNKGWAHVLARHFSGKNASQFTIPELEVKSLLSSERVVKTPVTRTLESNDGLRYVREVTLDKPIGLDKFNNFKPTNQMTVLTDKFGNLITASPGIIK